MEALESWANKRLTPEEAIETAVDEKALFAAIANATPDPIPRSVTNDDSMMKLSDTVER